MTRGQRADEARSGEPPSGPTWPRLQEPLSGQRLREVIATISEVKRLRRRILWSRRSIRERRDYITWYQFLGLPSSTWRFVSAPFRILAAVWRSGPTLRRTEGVPLPRQLAHVAWITLRWGLRPREYYLCGLYRPGGMRRAPLFITSRDHVEILLCLNSRSRPRLGKVEFWLRCREHGLPTIPILAECPAGAPDPILYEPDSPEWEGDLISKPSFGALGKELRLWRREEDGGYRDGDTRVASRTELLTWLMARTDDDGTVVQPRRSNHPVLAEVSSGALCGIRIDTIREPRSKSIEVLFAMARLPRTGAPADNLGHGSIAAAVDLETGRLGLARSATPGGLGPKYDTHPEAGNRILGREVPYWREVLELVNRAHSVSPEASLGWDVGVGESGPFLIETNRHWGCDLIHAVNDVPLGITSYPNHMLHYLKAEALRRRMEQGR